MVDADKGRSLMSLGSNLLDLQELDLGLMRDRKTLEELPEVRDLAKRRRAYAKLKHEATGILARRKDLETDLADLDEEERTCKEDIAAAQAGVDGSDYRSVQELEIKLSSLAKELDKISFARERTQEDLQQVQLEEQENRAHMKVVGDAILQGAETARNRASNLRAGIDDAEKRRARLVEQIGPEMAVRYDTAYKRFNGLAVEKLLQEEVGRGRSKTVRWMSSTCRMALQPSSVDGLAHAGEVGECPYCHRILVIKTDEE